MDIELVSRLAVDRVAGIMEVPKGFFMVCDREGMNKSVASYGIECRPLSQLEKLVWGMRKEIEVLCRED